jgi:hypothetical protein
MDEKYIGGFFDAEGSAMVLTIRRKLKTGVIYRFRPVIKIAQKTDGILEAIRDFMGYGHIDREKTTNSYIINGLEGILNFVGRIAPHCYIKQGTLLAVGELAELQQSLKRRNIPYSKEDTVKLIDIRDKVFNLNQLTRTALRQKYSRAQILNESTFVGDVREWQLKRGQKGLKAMIEKGKPFRFKKGAS